MKNVLIIGCGLLGSSLVKRIAKKKLAKKIFIFEKSKKNISKIKRLKLPGILVNKLQEVVAKSNLIIFCTPMSEYKKMILRLNNNFNSKQIITDVGSSKIESSEIIKRNLKKMTTAWNGGEVWRKGGIRQSPKLRYSKLVKNQLASLRS